MEKLNPKILALAAVVVLSSAGLGFSLEHLFSTSLKLDLSSGLLLLPLLLAFLLTTSFATVLSLVAGPLARGFGFVLAAVGFGLPFFLPPAAVRVPDLFVFLLPLAFFGGLLLLDYSVRGTMKASALFASGIFSTAYTRFFLFFVFAVTLLVYFSVQLDSQGHFKVPEEILKPPLELVVDRVIEQIQGQLGTQKVTEEEFIAELERSGLLQVLEQQFGVVLNPEEIGSSEELTESLREPLVAQLSQDLEDVLGPYLPFLPLILAVGTGLSILVLSPVLALLSVASFALVYRFLVRVRFAHLAEEQRTVSVLKVE